VISQGWDTVQPRTPEETFAANTVWQIIEVNLGPGEACEVGLVTPAIEGVAEMGLLTPTKYVVLGSIEQLAQKLPRCTRYPRCRYAWPTGARACTRETKSIMKKAVGKVLTCWGAEVRFQVLSSQSRLLLFQLRHRLSHFSVSVYFWAAAFCFLAFSMRSRPSFTKPVKRSANS
jgi:hypothetical protein